MGRYLMFVFGKSPLENCVCQGTLRKEMLNLFRSKAREINNYFMFHGFSRGKKKNVENYSNVATAGIKVSKIINGM